jgi:hypothetical protein
VSRRVFLLSPATCNGPRAQLLSRPGSRLPLAAELHAADGLPIGELFTFLSGLYFRGKLTYARAFASPPAGVHGALVITPHAGLEPPETRITAATLRAAAQIDIHAGNRRYREPLEATARALAGAIGERSDVVLLGSVATPKYVEVLSAIFGSRLLFPVDFVGRGDMSRGGLMLRAVREGRELTYAPVGAAPRHGPRPPRLPRPPQPLAGV